MPDLDPSIALSFKQADPMKSLSSMLSTANDALTYKRNQATFDADVQQKQATASSAGSKATVDAANVNPLIGQQAAQTSSAQTKADSDKFGLHKDYANTALQTASGLLSDPAITATGPNYSAEAAAKSITAAKNQMMQKGVPEEQALQAVAPLFMQMHTPGGIAQSLKNTVLGGMAPTSQAAAVTPGGVGVNNGAGSAVISTNPFTPQNPVGSALPGTAQTAQLPPTTAVVGGPNGTTPGVIGPQPGAAPGAPPQAVNAAGHPAVSPMQQRASDTDRAAIYSQERQQLAQQLQQAQQSGDPAAVARAQQDQANLEKEIVSNKVQMPQQAQQAQPTPGFIPTGMAAGRESSITQNNDVAHKHFTDLANGVQNSQMLEGIANNIKAFAPQAITGTEEGRLSFLNGVLAQLGSPQANDLKTAGDLLSKNTSMLTQNGNAGSDARQTLLQMAQPHVSMTPEAMKEASDQIIGQIRATRAGYSQFLPEAGKMNQTGDSGPYLKKIEDWQKVADPRVWQYESLSPADRKVFMSKLPPADAANLSQKARTLTEKYGLFK